jgi:hypothetical protein
VIFIHGKGARQGGASKAECNRNGQSEEGSGRMSFIEGRKWVLQEKSIYLSL